MERGSQTIQYILLACIIAFFTWNSCQPVSGAQGDCTTFNAPIGTNDTIGCTISPLDGSSCTLALLDGYELVGNSLTVSCYGGFLTELPVTRPKPCPLPATPPTGVTAGSCTTQILSGGNCTYQIQYGFTLESGALALSCLNGQLSSTIPVLSGALCYHPTITWFPLIEINPLSSTNVYRPKAVSLAVGQTPPPCNPILPADAVFEFEWVVSSVSTGVTDPSLEVLRKQSRELVIPENTLTVGKSYFIEVTCTLTSQIATPSSATRRLLTTTGTMSSSVTISVLPSPLLAILAGGDRTRHIDQAVVLDGSQSSDPDGSSALSYTWTCNKQTGGGGACPIQSGTTLTEPNLIFGAGTFPADQLYLLTLKVSSIDGRSSTAFVRLTTIAPFDSAKPVPLVSILNAPVTASPHEFVRMQATVLSESTTHAEDMKYHWTTDCLDLNLNDTSALASEVDSSSLVLRPFVRDGVFATCTFTCTVTDPAYPSTGIGSAAVMIGFNTPPSTGTCTPSVTQGTEFSTVFEVKCSGWIPLPATNAPLTYRLYYLESTTVAAFYAAPVGSIVTPLVFRPLTRIVSSSRIQTMLPQGKWRLQIWIEDRFGAQTRFTMPEIFTVIQQPAYFSGSVTPTCYLDSLSQTLLPSFTSSAEWIDMNTVLYSIASRLTTLNPAGPSDCSKQSILDLLSITLLTHASELADGEQVTETLLALVKNPLLLSSTNGVANMQSILSVALSALQTSALTDRTASFISSLSEIISRTLTSCTELDETLALLTSLLAIQTSRSFPGESLQALDTATFLAQSTLAPQRLGLTYSGPQGLSIKIPKGSDASVPTTVAQLDSASAVLVPEPLYRLDVILLKSNWSLCVNRSSELIGSAYQTTVEISAAASSLQSTTPIATVRAAFFHGDGTPITVLPGPIEVTLPLSKQGIASAQSIQCPPLYKQLTDFTPTAGCAALDSSSGKLDESKCSVGEYDELMGTITCDCTVLTEFGAVSSSKSLSSQLDERCWLLPSVLDAWWTGLYVGVYAVLLVWFTFQLARLLKAFGVKTNRALEATQAVLVLYTLLRLLDVLVYLALHTTFDPLIQVALHSLPWLILPCLLQHAVTAWADAYEKVMLRAQARSGEWIKPLAESPFRRFWLALTIANSLCSLAFLAMIISHATSNASDASFRKNVHEGLLWFVAAVLISLCGIYAVLVLQYKKALGPVVSGASHSSVLRVKEKYAASVSTSDTEQAGGESGDTKDTEKDGSDGGATGADDGSHHVKFAVDSSDQPTVPTTGTAVEVSSASASTIAPSSSTGSLFIAMKPSSSFILDDEQPPEPTPPSTILPGQEGYILPKDRFYKAAPVPSSGDLALFGWMVFSFSLLQVALSILLILTFQLGGDFERHPELFLAVYHFGDCLSIMALLPVYFYPVRKVLCAEHARLLRLSQIALAEAEDAKALATEQARLAKEAADRAAAKALAEKLAAEAEAARIKAAEEAAAKAEAKRLAELKEAARKKQQEEKELAEKIAGDKALAKALQQAAIAKAVADAAKEQASMNDPAAIAAVALARAAAEDKKRATANAPPPPAFLALSPAQGIQPATHIAFAAADEPDTEDLEPALGEREHEVLTEAPPSDAEVRALQRAALMYTTQAESATVVVLPGGSEPQPSSSPKHSPSSGTADDPALISPTRKRTWTIPAAGAPPPSDDVTIRIQPSTKKTPNLLMSKLNLLKAANTFAAAAKKRSEI